MEKGGSMRSTTIVNNNRRWLTREGLIYSEVMAEFFCLSNLDDVDTKCLHYAKIGLGQLRVASQNADPEPRSNLNNNKVRLFRLFST